MRRRESARSNSKQGKTHLLEGKGTLVAVEFDKILVQRCRGLPACYGRGDRTLSGREGLQTRQSTSNTNAPSSWRDFAFGTHSMTPQPGEVATTLFWGIGAGGGVSSEDLIDRSHHPPPSRPPLPLSPLSPVRKEKELEVDGLEDLVE